MASFTFTMRRPDGENEQGGVGTKSFGRAGEAMIEIYKLEHDGWIIENICRVSVPITMAQLREIARQPDDHA